MDKFVTFKYVDPITEKCYMTVIIEWDEIYDGPWKEEGFEKIIKIKREDNHLKGGTII